MEWSMAMVTGVTGKSMKAKSKIALVRVSRGSQMMVPRTFTEMCMTATRLAWVLAPMLEMRAVTQVPMFCPMMMGMAMA